MSFLQDAYDNASTIADQKIAEKYGDFDPNAKKAPSYLLNTPSNQVIRDPEFLSDIRNYYSKYKEMYFADDKEMLERYYADQTFDRNNLTLGATHNLYESMVAGDEEKEHMARLSEGFDKIPDFYQGKGSFADELGGDHVAAVQVATMATDPLNYVGIGLGYKAAQGLGRSAQALGKGLTAPAIKAASRAVGLEAGVGAGFAVADDSLQQAYRNEVGLQDGYDTGRGLTAAAGGAAFGTVLGGIAGAFGAVAGVRIGARQADALSHAGHTPESIQKMTSDEVQTILSDPDFMALGPNGEASSQQAASNQSEGAKYDTPPTQRGWESPQKQEAPVTEPKAIDPETGLPVESDATGVPLTTNVQVVDQAMDRIKEQINDSVDPDVTVSLEDYYDWLLVMRTKSANINDRMFEVEELMQTASGAELKALSAEHRSLRDMQREIDNLRNDMDGASPLVETEATPVTTPKAEAVDEPVVVAPEEKFDPEARAEGEDPVAAAAEESAPAAKGRKRAELTDDIIELLGDMGVNPKRIDKAAKSTTTSGRKSRKALMRQAASEHGLYESEAALDKANINELYVKLTEYINAKKAENAAKPEAPEVPKAPEGGETQPKIDAAIDAANDLVDPAPTGTAKPKANAIDDAINEAEALIPSREPEAKPTPRPAGLTEAIKKPTKKETAKKQEAKKPDAPDAPAKSPFNTGRSAGKRPTKPVEMADADTRTLGGSKLVSEEGMVVVEGAIEALFGKNSKHSDVMNITLTDLDYIIRTGSDINWSLYANNNTARIEALRTLEEVFEIVAPMGIKRHVQDRAAAMGQIKQLFADDKAGAADAMQFLARLDDTGVDGLPIFLEEIGDTYKSGSADGPLKGTNEVGMHSGDRAILPKAMTFYHEVAHWMYSNVLTSADRMSFLDMTKKLYSADGRFDENALNELMPWGKDLVSGPYMVKANGTDFSHNGTTSPQEMFAQQFSIWAMRNMASPDVKVESYWQKIKHYVQYVYERVINGKDVVDPDLEKLFTNVMTSEQQIRDAIADTVEKTSIKNATPSTEAGKHLRTRIALASDTYQLVEDSLGSTTIIDNMKDLGAYFFGFNPNPKYSKGKTGGFRQTAVINDELRKASEEIYTTISEFFGEAKGKQGGEVDWEDVLSGAADLDHNAEIELSEKLATLWEKEGGIRDLTERLDDLMRAQYFRHEQKLILSPMMKGSPAPNALNIHERKVVLEWQSKRPQVKYPELTRMPLSEVNETLKKKGGSLTNKAGVRVYGQSVGQLQGLLKHEDEAVAFDAANELLKLYRLTPAPIPVGYKSSKEIYSMKPADMHAAMRQAAFDMASGDKSAKASAKETFKSIRYEISRRALKKRDKKNNRNKSVIEVSNSSIFAAREVALFSGELDRNLPDNLPVRAKEFIESFSHRDPVIRRSLQTVAFRFLNALDPNTKNAALDAKFLTAGDLALTGNAYKPEGGRIQSIEITSPEVTGFVSRIRKYVVMIDRGNDAGLRDGFEGIAKLVMRTHVLPAPLKLKVLDIYRTQPESVKSAIRGKIKTSNELREAEQFFAEGFMGYLSDFAPSERNVFSNLNYKDIDKTLDIFDSIREGVSYFTEGVVDKSKLTGIYDALAFAQPLTTAANVLDGARETVAFRDMKMTSITPDTAEAVVNSYYGSMPETQKGLLHRFVSGLGAKADGSPLIFWHSSPFGSAFARGNDPVLRPSVSGALGRGVYLTPNAKLSHDVYAQRPTIGAMLNMIDEKASAKGLDLHGETVALARIEGGVLVELQSEASAFAKKTIELDRRIIDTEAKLGGDNSDARIDRLESSLTRMIEEREVVKAQRISIEADITARQDRLNDLVGIKPEPVMLPLVIRADRVADFRANSVVQLGSEMVQGIIKTLRKNYSAQSDSASATKLINQASINRTTLADAVESIFSSGQEVRGASFYRHMVAELAGETGDLIHAQSIIDDILEELGYQAKISHNRNTLTDKAPDGELVDSRSEVYEEVVMFNSEDVKHIGSDLFDGDEMNMFASSIEPILDDAPNPNGALLQAAINTDGPINNKGFADALSGVEESSGNPTFVGALVNIAKRRPLTEGQKKALSLAGPRKFLGKGSDRLRASGMKWVGDFIQPETGVGLFERQNSELGRKIIPILQKINKLPEAKGSVGRWMDKNNPMHVKQTGSVRRIVKTLRRNVGHASEKRLTPDEFAIYQELRDLFQQEAISLKESGVMMGNIEDYFPQIWNTEALLKDKDKAVDRLARHLMRESVTERDADITVEQAFEKAEHIFTRLTDDEGVYMPPPTGGRRDVTGDHIDYQRMLRLDHYGDSLKDLEEFLEDDLEGMMTKYFDLSTRRIEMAKKFGTNSHGYYDYLYAVEHGLRGISDLMTKGKVFTRDVVVPMAGGTERASIEHTLLTPPTTSDEVASQWAREAHGLVRTQGKQAGKDFLMGIHERPTPTWEKRVDAIVNALDDFDGKTGMVPEDEFKFAQGMFNTIQRKPPNPNDTFFNKSNQASKFLRSVNSVTLLGWTTLTSLGDLALPLVRSGDMRAWSKGMAKWAKEPDYREAIQRVGVAVENLTHERLTHLVGADSTKATNAFFNFTLLTPWTNMNREVAGAVFHQAIIAEQRRALSHPKDSRKYKTAMRFLNRYGLADYAKKGARDLNDPAVLASEQAVRDGMIRFANESIFTPNANDIPLWAQTPWGSVMFQLKSFPLMMQRLSVDVVKEAGKGNPFPMLYMLTAGAGFGMVSLGSKDVAQVRGGEDGTSPELRKRNFLKALGYDKDVHGDANDFAGWYLEGLIQMGGFGLIANMMHDTTQQLDNGAYGFTRTMSTVFGPSVGLMGSVYNTAAGITDSKPSNAKERQAAREVIGRVPVIGGVKAIKEGAVDAITGAQDDGKSSSKSGWGSGYSDGFGGGF